MARIAADGVAEFAPADTSLIEKVTAVEAGIRAGGGVAGNSYALFEHEANTYLYQSAGQGAATPAGYEGAALVRLSGLPLDGAAFALIDGVLTAA